MDVIKSITIKDNNLIIHFGKKEIDSTRFIVFDKSLALQFIKELTKYLRGIK